MYIIKGTLWGHTDTLDHADNLADALFKRAEYKAAFGPSWVIELFLL